jgi:NTP pyrophosphatase (non-canonical NTP hydrolase)
MEISEIQKQFVELVRGYNENVGHKENKKDMILHLVEEVGELAGEANKEHMYWKKDFDKERLSSEIIDVLGQLLYIADAYEVDIDEVFEKKMIKWKERFKQYDNIDS